MKKKHTAADSEQPSFLRRCILQRAELLQNPQKVIIGFFTFFVVVVPQVILQHEWPFSVLLGMIMLDILFFYLFFFCLCGHRSTGTKLGLSQFYLVSALTAIYFLAANLIDNNAFYQGIMPISIALPTALIILLVTIMVNVRHARTMGLLLPLGAFLNGSFDFYSFIFALMSGIAASFVLRGAKRRIDMVNAGCILALVHVVTVLALLLFQNLPLAVYPAIVGFAALNGIASGMLVLGITPVLEQLMRTATAFRLIELLDLGAPLMRLLASKTPGTYSHSLVVANLAEAACQEIGAHSLLGRVGAYYHDIGKIDQPDYFVENQRAGNKHDDINPRLSATVIRSHVKVGIEKGRAAGLPNEVIDIIASHHGNSLIAYFYNEALKKEENVDMEDFCYPGHPPQTKEAAVVMLADVTEAAVRTLDKPGSSRLEKFINELITKKVDSAQLSESELTFRELETIKKVFVRVLAGYYHTRIEYPNQPKESKEPAKDDA
ncbi:MAG: HDIG domain-containing protein [Spirochaetaceae bacterium]|jgi:putative nucleotidyltransferase with HDIG domain|nr:HDIG domain-containing protein [Spirochaetaceae bacterium]